MNIKINRVSSSSKKSLIEKIENKDFTYNNNGQYKAALIDNNEVIDIYEIFEKNRDKDFFSDSHLYFYSGTKQSQTAFLFPGQGSQYINMGKEIKKIYTTPIYENGDEVFSKISNRNQLLSDIIFPDDSIDAKQAELNLQKTDAAQPAIGITSALYLSILKDLNIFPNTASGHSFGEISALYSAGSFDMGTFIKIASTRGKLMAECGKDKDAGSMMAVLGTIEKIKEVIDQEGLNLVLANKNSPKQNVVSGPGDEIDKAVKIFRKHKLRGVKLPVAAAFHSPLVEDAALPFSKFIDSVDIKPPQIPVTSNTTGDFHEDQNIKKLLSKQLINPVCFTDNLKSLFDIGIKVFIEVGPKKVLTDLAKQSAPKGEDFFFASLDESAGKTPILDFAKVLSLLFVLGFEPDIDKWNRL